VDRMKPKKVVGFILGCFLMIIACHKAPVSTVVTSPAPSQPIPVSPPPPVPVPATWPELPLPPSRLPSPPEPPLPKSYRDGEAYFQGGNYAEAIRFYEKYLQEDPVTQYRDVAIFKLGISHILACLSAECRTRSLERSQEQFKRLVSLFPRSPYSAEARFILSLQSDIDKLKLEARSREDRIKKLADELERLKKIDLERQTSRTKK
jgi:hypothetical protein